MELTKRIVWVRAFPPLYFDENILYLLTELCLRIYLPLSVWGGLPDLPIKLYVSLSWQSKKLWNSFLIPLCLYSSHDSRLLRVKLWIIYCFSFIAQHCATKMPHSVHSGCMLAEKNLYLYVERILFVIKYTDLNNVLFSPNNQVYI